MSSPDLGKYAAKGWTAYGKAVHEGVSNPTVVFPQKPTYPLDYGLLCSKLHDTTGHELAIYAMHYDKPSDSVSPAQPDEHVHHYDLDIEGYKLSEGQRMAKEYLDLLELTDLPRDVAMGLGLFLSELLSLPLEVRGGDPFCPWAVKFDLPYTEY